METKILIAGGYGLIGSTLASQIREVYPEVHLMLAGRNPEKGEALARLLGNCSTVHLDLDEPETLTRIGHVDLVVAALKDRSDALVRLAMDLGAAHIGITKLASEIAPTVLAAHRQPAKQPIVLLGHWQAGVLTMAGMHAAEPFGRIDAIELSALYDPRDPIGPMTAEDSEEFIGRALIRQMRNWISVEAMGHARQFQLTDQEEPAIGHPLGVLDVPSLAAATGAADIRFDLTQGDSIGTRAGKTPSHDLYIDIEGILHSGERAKRRTVLSDPNGQAHLTALGIFIALERVLGLDGKPAATGGIQFPETLLQPADSVERLRRFGVRIES